MNFTVWFYPNNVSISVPEGTLLSDAAAMAEISEIHLPCGARKTCNKCVVEITLQDEKTAIQVLACQHSIEDNLSVRLPEIPTLSSTTIVTDSLSENCALAIDELSPLIKSYTFTLNEPSIENNYSDLEQLEQQIMSHCGAGTVHCNIDILKTLASKIREYNHEITVTISTCSSIHNVVAINSKEDKTTFGIACDIGTTTIAIQLIDLSNGKVLSSKSDYNAQISRGADVISRIDYARTQQKLDELRTLVLNAINTLISEISKENHISPIAISSMTVAANCTMTHLFIGLPPRYIREHPYVPTVNKVPILSARELELSINPNAPVLFSPGVGSYVGGDITSGLLCTKFIHEDKLTIFIDIGTNGEIVIGNKDFLLTCACSAGPAFEGSGIHCGMRAEPGAIDSFKISPNDNRIDYTVIDNKTPKGICGSGLICLLGELVHAQYIDRSGKFTEKITSKSTFFNSTLALVLVPGDKTANNEPIIITESDIENLIRTKAAIYAACDLMLSNVGLDISNVEQILIAGGFGKYIDIDQSIRIGLFPDIDRKKYRYLGNTSLAGAALSLRSKKHREMLNSIAQKMTYVELSNDPNYMNSYVSALFLPHTDLSRFPSDNS